MTFIGATDPFQTRPSHRKVASNALLGEPHTVVLPLCESCCSLEHQYTWTLTNSAETEATGAAGSPGAC